MGLIHSHALLYHPSRRRVVMTMIDPLVFFPVGNQAINLLGCPSRLFLFFFGGGTTVSPGSGRPSRLFKTVHVFLPHVYVIKEYKLRVKQFLSRFDFLTKLLSIYISFTIEIFTFSSDR